MTRNHFLFVFLFAFSIPLSAGTPTPEPTVENGVAWYDASKWKAEGRGWDDTSTPFTRIPLRAKETIPPAVWNLSQHSAGVVVRFKTDATKILARHEVGGNLTMPHMTTVGSSGLDLYTKNDKGAWRWAGFSRPGGNKYEQALLDGVSKVAREYMLYLPLYNNTVALSVGVPEGSVFEALPPSDKKPIFYYGTSIAHGCSASRPGMATPEILGRRFDRPVINFGFSGSGRMEPAMAELVREVDAAVFVLDCLPNMSPQEVAERSEMFVRKLREAHPETPIVMVEDRTFTNAWLKPQVLKTHAERREPYRKTFEKLATEGFKKLYYVEGDQLLGDDDEGTVDASHPNDLGMMRQAEVLEPVLRKALE